MYGLYIEPNRLVLSEVTIELDRIGKDLTIAHISDLHIEGMGRREKRVVETLRKACPDLLVVTGDFVNPGRGGVNALLWMIREFRARYGVFGVWGNVDHRLLTQKEKERIEKAGIVILQNRATRIREDVWVVGVDDPVTGRDDIEEALIGVPEDSFKILLSHSPIIDKRAVEKGVDLVLAGHTHGGQVYIPLISHLLLHLHHSKWYVRGLYKVEGTYLYVTRGIGTTFIPLRIFSPPEITLVRLKRGQKRLSPTGGFLGRR